MDLVRDLISIGRYVREESKIKVRQPLSEALIYGKLESIIDDLVTLTEEVIRKKVIFANDLSKYMNFLIKPIFKVIGIILITKIKEYQTVLLNLNFNEINDMITLSGKIF